MVSNPISKNNKIALYFLVMGFVLLSAPFARAEKAHEKHIIEATRLLKEMSVQSDVKTMALTVKSAKGIVIFPSLIQGGFGWGAQYGEGIVLIKSPKGVWMGPSFVSLTGASLGLQIGVTKIGLLLVINNENGLHPFLSGKNFKLGGGLSIAAGPVGRDAEIATDSRFKASIYSYSISRGLFAGITLKGAIINVNRDANLAYWGRRTEAEGALKRIANGEKISPLIEALRKLIVKAQ